MRRAKHVGLVLATVAVGFGLMACDWDFGGSVDQSNDAYNWIEFSGVYRGIDGAPLVSNYSESAEDDTPRRVTNEAIGNTNGASSVFSGTLRNRPVVAGSLQISLPGFNFVDQGNGTLLAEGGETGRILYSTGAWSVDCGGAPDAGAIRATYAYTIVGTPAGSGGSTRIVTFNVVQTGNTLRFTDNNGAVYEGQMGRVRSTGTQESWTQVYGQFTVRGRSVTGHTVTISGTLQAERVGTAARRTMFGTWLETGGRNGDVRGQANDVAVPAGQ